MAYDVRALANLVLDRADQCGREVSNVHINKTLYFLHVWYLLRECAPLTGAKIEAWDYGPVFREVYQQFKGFGKNPIKARALCIDFSSGERKTCTADFSPRDIDFLLPLIDHYLDQKPFDLVELTHKKGTPWDLVYNHGGRSNPGMRISDDMIVDYYSHQTRQ